MESTSVFTLPHTAASSACPVCMMVFRDAFNATRHLLSQHGEWLLRALTSTRDAWPVLTQLLFSGVFLPDFVFVLAALRDLALARSFDNNSMSFARARGSLELLVGMASGRGFSAAVLRVHRNQVVGLVASDSGFAVGEQITLPPSPHQRPPPPPATAASPATPPRPIQRVFIPPGAPRVARERVRVVSSPVLDGPLPRPIHPLHDHLDVNVWDRATRTPWVRVLKDAEAPHEATRAALWEDCAICMEPMYTVPLDEARTAFSRHFACRHKAHWLHDTCLAGYMEHALAERGVAQIDVSLAALGDPGSRLWEMDERQASALPLPFRCPSCRAPFESYHGMAAFVAYVQTAFTRAEYTPPSYWYIRNTTRAAREAENENALTSLLMASGSAVQGYVDLVEGEEDEEEIVIPETDDEDGEYYIQDAEHPPDPVTMLPRRYNLRLRPRRPTRSSSEEF